MAYNTLTQQGLFTSTGVAKTIIMRSDVDWMMTWNLTAMADTVQFESVRHYWQRELPLGDHMIDYHAAGGSQAISMSTGLVGYNGVVRPGFYPIDSSVGVTAVLPVTAGTNVVAPVYSVNPTAPFPLTGAIYRVYGGAHTNLNGLDFTGTTVLNTSVTVTNALATAPGIINGAGFIRMVAPDLATYKLFRPQNRVIANITAANPAVVTTLVDHGYSNGDLVRFRVPAGCGMTQMNGLTGTVTVLTAGTFSVDIDSTAFTAFAFPLPAAVPFTPAEVTPVGESNVNTLNDAVYNQGYIGIVLAAGQGSPAGENGDVIKWLAGKSFHTFTP